VEFLPILQGIYWHFQKYISQLIKQGIAQGLFDKNFDPDLAAYVFLAIHDGSLHQWMINRVYIDTRKYLSTYRKMFFSGLMRAVDFEETG